MNCIQSLLDTDFYKITMLQAFWKLDFNNTPATYKFVDRSNSYYSFEDVDNIKKELHSLCQLRFNYSDIQYLRSLNLFEEDFLNFLISFHLEEKNIRWEKEYDQIKLYFHGNLLQQSMFEIYVMAIISEIKSHSQLKAAHIDIEQVGEKLLQNKINEHKNNSFPLADFGTRRRLSYAWQKKVVSKLHKEWPEFLGTSNILLSKELGTKPVGTMAHEWFQIHQGFYPIIEAQKKALDNWILIYQDKLGVALTDIYNMDIFCKDFTSYHADNFHGLRHDSGDPIIWGEKALQLFLDRGAKKEEIKNRTLVFSDGLNFKKAQEIHQFFKDKAKLVFGIGTHLTNDFGIKAPNIVIKNIATNNLPTIKISDEPGKTICEDKNFIKDVQEKLMNWPTQTTQLLNNSAIISTVKNQSTKQTQKGKIA